MKGKIIVLKFIVVSMLFTSYLCNFACVLHHMCKSGHLYHETSLGNGWIFDLLWLGNCFISSLLSWKYNFRILKWFCLLFLLLIVFRLYLSNFSWFIIL